ncbi:MAG: LysR family transcriptional regulator, partial [Lachnospiraceae bacterium]|nr:LysR family transcriptional regulator [Lachnospiraceae bacterium]
MTLNQLRNVIAIADTGSMNEAAKQLYIAQPSLSQSVRELEKEIGVELFRRGNRGVVLTLEGEEFLSYARQVIEQYELMENRYVEKKNVKKKFGVS